MCSIILWDLSRPFCYPVAMEGVGSHWGVEPGPMPCKGEQSLCGLSQQ